MNRFFKIFLLTMFGVSLATLYAGTTEDVQIISYQVDPKEIKFFHKDDKGNIFGNFVNIRKWLKSKDKRLIFAMNGGMYLRDLSPQGLYIENGYTIKKANTIQEAYGNFYMQPNGVFAIDKNGTGYVMTTHNYLKNHLNLLYATQSGPMLLIDGKVHHKFNPNSQHVHIRNGVGILPDGKLLFAISKKKIRFYDFAMFFKNNGCKNALYLDGFVSRVYLLEQNITNQDGIFGIIIAQIKDG